jgi:hypothetical protein
MQATKTKLWCIWINLYIRRRQQNSWSLIFFALHAVNVSWKTDPHYTTDQDELDDVFGVG